MSYEKAGIKEKPSLKKIICSAVLLAAVFSAVLFSNKNAPSVSVAAATIKEQENKINSLKNQQSTNKKNQQEIQREIANIKSRANNQLELKNAHDREIILLQEEIQLYEDMVDCQKIKIEAQKEQIAEAEAEYDRSLEECRALMVYAYEEGNMDYISMLLDSKNLDDFLSHIDIINDMMEYTKSMLEKFGDDTRILKETKVMNEEAYKSQLDYMNQIEESKEILKIKIDEANQTLASLAKEQESAEAAAAKILKDESDMQNLILKASSELTALKKAEAARIAEDQRKANAAKSGSGTTKASSSTAYVGGTGGWPVTPKYKSNPVSSGYGWRKSPITGKQEFHLGIDIPAEYGSGVYSFNSGTVILSGWYSSYGNCVVVDHGGGVTTLYAHNSSNTVKVGAAVNKGQVIAKVGSTGASTGNHVHFEVSVNGERQDPMKYLS